MSLTKAAANLRAALTDASHGLVERESLVETIALAVVAREHLLVIGPPGTAKSEAVRRFARATNARTFEYLLGRFTEPAEIFGPIDIRRLRDGVVETQVHGMLPEAEVAFLDEVFQGSTAILNTLLTILNERVFRRGHTTIRCPLEVCIGASNALPDDDSLAAFADRFLLRVFVEPIADPRLEELLAGGAALSETAGCTVSMDDVHTLGAAARVADLTPVRPRLAEAIRMLRRAGIELSDRRAVRVQRLLAAAAVLAGRTNPSEADLWPIILAVPSREGQELARETLRDLLASSANQTLPVATVEASRGPLARAAQILSVGRDLLKAPPATALEQTRWRLRLEGVAREIDAGFDANSRPAELSEVRAAIVEALG